MHNAEGPGLFFALILFLDTLNLSFAHLRADRYLCSDHAAQMRSGVRGHHSDLSFWTERRREERSLPLHICLIQHSCIFSFLRTRRVSWADIPYHLWCSCNFNRGTDLNLPNPYPRHLELLRLGCMHGIFKGFSAVFLRKCPCPKCKKKRCVCVCVWEGCVCKKWR